MSGNQNNNCARITEDGIKLTIMLKQKTPMIHFQWNEPGVCIRGSELKPKLDKFLVEKLEKEYTGKKKDSEYYTYFINEPDSNGMMVNMTLNYKTRLIADGTKITSSNINKLYFGNMNNNKKKSVFYNSEIKLIIICLNDNLRKLIKNNIIEFFAVTNFGLRQDKGFGCFSISGVNGEDVKDKLEKNGYKFFYGSIADEYSNDEVENKADDMLNIAGSIYSVMKGGINYKGTYIKGYIQRQYLDDIKLKNTNSEKVLIKSELFDGNARKGKYVYVRALLGTTDNIVFRDKDRKRVVSIENKDIERFPTPMTIKIIDNYIFFIFNDTFNAILGKEFNFKYNDKEKKINVPNEFNVDTFMNKFIDYYNDNKSKISDKKSKNIELQVGENNGK